MKMVKTHVCLLIDDDPINQEMFGRALNEVSSETIYFTSPSGYDALYMISEEAVVPSIIIIESTLPGMTCIDLIKSLRGNIAVENVPIVVHALRPHTNFIAQLKESGAQAIYYNSYNYDTVCSLLENYVGQNEKMLFLN